MKSISIKAYAKVNLSLDVTGKLNNGYHTLRSVMQAVNLFDELTVTVSEDSDRGSNSESNDNSNGGIILHLEFDADERLAESDVTADSNNLAYKAAVAMQKRYKPDPSKSCEKIEISLKKKIPVAAGLAGGSSDAAAVILALAHLWKLEANLDELIQLGMTIGADIPFCLISNAKNNRECGYANDKLASSAALAEGIGEILTPIPSLYGSLIIVKPPIAVSTPVIYSLYDEREDLVIKRPDNEALIAAIKDFEPEMESEVKTIVFDNIVNVLEPIARSEYTVVAETLDTLIKLIPGSKIFMSGSGPTAVAYFETHIDALKYYIIIFEKFLQKSDIFMMKLLK